MLLCGLSLYESTHIENMCRKQKWLAKNKADKDAQAFGTNICLLSSRRL